MVEKHLDLLASGTGDLPVDVRCHAFPGDVPDILVLLAAALGQQRSFEGHALQSDASARYFCRPTDGSPLVGSE